MVEETLKKFELNNTVLEDFDTLMSKHLDQIEELVVSEIDTKSKLLNIVGLCINIKTLVIEGDERTNVNSVIASICKPELLQNLILNGVKIPSSFSFKKLTSLKMLSLNNIRACSAKAGLDEIVNPEKIEALNFEQVDFAKNSIECIKRFENLKYLNLIKVQNCKLDNLEFFSEMKNLERINIEKNIIKFSEINNLIKCKFSKKVQVDLPTPQNEIITNNLEINEKGKVFITINNNGLEELTKNLNLFKVTDIIVIVSNDNNLKEHIHTLKRVKGKVSIAIKDVSCLTVKEAKTLREELKIKNIKVVDFDEALQYEKNRYTYPIDNYIKLRTEIDKQLEQINSEADELLKFLQIYRIIGENVNYDETLEDNFLSFAGKKDNSSYIEKALNFRNCASNGFAELLKNMLACIGIESKIVRGNIVGTGKEHTWNQVKVLDKWYNVDLALDSKRISNQNKRKSKPINCLISDKNFGKTHIPKIANTEYCPENIDKRIISAYFKRDFNVKAYIDILVQKIKMLFTFNNQKALPEGKGKHEK